MQKRKLDLHGGWRRLRDDRILRGRTRKNKEEQDLTSTTKEREESGGCCNEKSRLLDFPGIEPIWDPDPKGVNGCVRKNPETPWQVYTVMVPLVLPPKEPAAIAQLTVPG